MTLHEFNTLYSIAADKEAVKKQIKNAPKPLKLAGVDIPPNLYKLTLGELVFLTTFSTDAEMIDNACEVFKITGILEQPAEDAIGFLNWLQKELEKIVKMFTKTNSKPTSEEVQAGIQSLNFGWFGTIDYFAQRMHITHEDAEKTSWVKVYKCLDMDKKVYLFRKRLSQIRNKQHSKKR